MRIRILVLSTLLALSGAASALTPDDVKSALAAEVKATDPAFKDFSAQRGNVFFHARHGGEWSCATCHTEVPAASGQHTVTKKPIRPLAPAANAERFTNQDKVDKWFKRNCNDVAKRACTAREKGDVLAYLMSVKP